MIGPRLVIPLRVGAVHLLLLIGVGCIGGSDWTKVRLRDRNGRLGVGRIVEALPWELVHRLKMWRLMLRRVVHGYC